MKIILVILVVGVVLWSAYGYFAVRNIEEPKYTVVGQKDGYEIRKYAPHLVAEARVEGTFSDSLNQGFRLIADYIFGNNTESSQIAMTVPVAEQKGVAIAMTVPVAEVQEGGLRVISFVMPSKYTLATIPKPNNSKVKLREVPERTMAVLSYSWWSGAPYVEAKKKKLQTLVAQDGYTAVGEPEAAFYNPPWTPPFLLRNEILIEIQ